MAAGLAKITQEHRALLNNTDIEAYAHLIFCFSVPLLSNLVDDIVTVDNDCLDGVYTHVWTPVKNLDQAVAVSRLELPLGLRLAQLKEALLEGVARLLL